MRLSSDSASLERGQHLVLRCQYSLSTTLFEHYIIASRSPSMRFPPEVPQLEPLYGCHSQMQRHRTGCRLSPVRSLIDHRLRLQGCVLTVLPGNRMDAVPEHSNTFINRDFGLSLIFCSVSLLTRIGHRLCQCMNTAGEQRCTELSVGSPCHTARFSSLLALRMVTWGLCCPRRWISRSRPT